MTRKPASDEEVYTLIGGARGMEARSGAAIERAGALPIWTGPVEPTLLSGGLSNINLSVDDAGRRYVIRVGEDEPVFGVSRAHELLAFRAAHAAGVAPEVVYAEPALMVIRFIDGASLLPMCASRRVSPRWPDSFDGFIAKPTSISSRRDSCSGRSSISVHTFGCCSSARIDSTSDGATCCRASLRRTRRWSAPWAG